MMPKRKQDDIYREYDENGIEILSASCLSGGTEMTRQQRREKRTFFKELDKGQIMRNNVNMRSSELT